MFWDHHDGEKRELDALLCLSSWCLMLVVWLFLSVPLVCLQFVIVIFPNRTHLLFLGVIHANSDGFGESAHFAWSSLSLRPSSKFLCGGSNGD